MKRKYFLIVSFLILVVFLSGCFSEMNTLRATIIIDDWEQRYFEIENDQVEIWYKIFNTGNERIGDYKVWFIAYCEDGSSYQGYSTGYWVDIGSYDRNICFVGIDKNKKAVSVEIIGRQLTAFIYD